MRPCISHNVNLNIQTEYLVPYPTTKPLTISTTFSQSPNPIRYATLPTTHPTPTTTPTTPHPPPQTSKPLLAKLFFATFAVPVTPVPTNTLLAVQLAPQTYPDGQHPFPSSPTTPLCLAQLNHPNAQPPSPNPSLLTCATPTVTPSLATAVEVDTGGQDVRAQSRPRRQQPGWAKAEQS